MNSFEPQVKAVEKQVQNDLTLSLNDLMPGDILATTTESKSSGLIRWATKGPFSHAIMVLFNGYAVDALPGEGVTKALLTWKLNKASYAVVFRHRTASSEQTSLAANWAASQSEFKKPYDYPRAALSALEPKNHLEVYETFKALKLSAMGPAGQIAIREEFSRPENPDDQSFFCSELIFRAYSVAHIPLLDQPATVYHPNRLLETTQLVRLGNLKWA